MSGDLDAFLKGGNPPEASPPTSTDGGTAATASGTGDGKPDAGKPDPGQAAHKNATPAKPAATPDPDDDAEPGDPEPGQPKAAPPKRPEEMPDGPSRASVAPSASE